MFNSKGFKLVLLFVVLALCLHSCDAGFKNRWKKVKKGVKSGFNKVYNPIKKTFKKIFKPIKKFLGIKDKKVAIKRPSDPAPKDPKAPPKEKFEDQVVRLHQEVRVRQNVESNTTLSWDKGIALEAMKWAKKCDNRYWNFKNGKKETYGQNLYVVKHGTVDVYEAVMDWEATKELYDPLKEECLSDKNCYPFLQMIWPETKLIGCALNACKDVASLGVSGSVFACFYTPI